MPTYQFQDKDGVVSDVVMRVSELDSFESNHPELKYVYGTAPMIDIVRLGMKKPDQSFRELLKEIHKKSGGNRHHHWD